MAATYTFDNTLVRNTYVITQSVPYGSMFDTNNLTLAYDNTLANILLNKFGLNGSGFSNFETVLNSSATRVLFIQYELLENTMSLINAIRN